MEGKYMDRATLKSMAKEQIRGNIGVLFAITLLMELILLGLNCIPLVGFVALLLLGSAFSLAIYKIYLDLADGLIPRVGDMFSQVQYFWPAFKVNFLVGLFTYLWSLLFIIPGIIKACSYSQAMYILAENPDMGALDAINQSKEMMEGHKMEYFLLGLSFIGWILLSPFTLGLLYIWLIPYMQATFANFYRSL